MEVDMVIFLRNLNIYIYISFALRFKTQRGTLFFLFLGFP